jgi:hypothetical protein
MKKLIKFLAIVIPNLLFSQVNGGIRLYISSNTVNYENIIAFSDQTTDLADNCCDAVSIGQSSALYTAIGQTEYIINSFSQLTDDRWIPIGVRCPSQEFEIGVNLIIQNEIPCMVWDSLTNELYEMPHQFSGPVNSEQRFKIFFEYPLSVSVINICDTTQVVINDDNTIGEYTLLYSGTTSIINSDTIYLSQNGQYELQVQGDTIDESVDFTVENITNEYTQSLNIPLTSVPIIDPVIVPTLELNYNPEQIIWNFGDGTFAYDDINPVHIYTEPGLYNLSCTIISEDGCQKVLNSLISVYLINSLDPIIKKTSKYQFYYGLDGRLMKKM